ncbi:MAG: tetratricopeptide repeat protein [Intrasporangiaceae bacterium]|nr:tetratricopeptide repeat protein [Intrasporangiaceae bacterium]
MSSSPFSAAALRGAVDLSGLKNRPAPGSTPPPASPAGADTAGGTPGVAVRQVTDATFQQAVESTTSVAAVFVLFSSTIKESVDFIDDVVSAASRSQGRLQVLVADINSNLQIRQAFQVQSVPVVLGLVNARPVPLFGGIYPVEEIAGVFDQLVQLADQQGVTGRVGPAEPTTDDGATEAEPTSPHHDAAYAAIEAGDLAGAKAAYEAALAENPQDEDARLGLGQVALIERTSGADLQAARTAAAERPDDIDAQLLVSDFDVLGGHIEDAFTRLVDLVRATSGAERDRVREHLIGLFDVVGNADERVKRGRTALMSALF